MVPGAHKTDIDSYLDRTKPHIETLIKDQLKEMGSAKIIKTVWIRWKKPVKLAITLNAEDIEGVQDIGDITGDNYTRVEIPFSSLMMEFFEDSNTTELIQCMFEQIQTQIGNLRVPESGFTLDQIMQLHINFYRLRGSSYMKLPE